MLYNNTCNPQDLYAKNSNCMRMLLPPVMENMLLFALTKVKIKLIFYYFKIILINLQERLDNLPFYMDNIMKKFRILQGSSLELILCDIIRYLINLYHPSVSKENKVKTMKWILLFCKVDVARSFAKQSLLIDWLYYIP